MSLTLEQLQAMNATPANTVQPQKTAGLTFEELQAMHGSTPTQDNSVSVMGTLGKFLGGVVSGAKNVVLHPIDTGKNIVKSIVNTGANFSNSALSNAGALGETAGQKIGDSMAGGKLDNWLQRELGIHFKTLAENGGPTTYADKVQKQGMQINHNSLQRALTGDDAQTRDLSTGKGWLQTAGDLGSDALNVASFGEGGVAKNVIKDVGKTALKDIGTTAVENTAKVGLGKILGQAGKYGAMYGVTSNLQSDQPTTLGGLFNSAVEGSGQGVGMAGATHGLTSLGNKVVRTGIDTYTGTKDLINTPTEKLRADAVKKGIEGTGDRLKTVKTNINKNTFTIKDTAGNKKIISPMDTIKQYGIEPEVSIKGDIKTDNGIKKLDDAFHKNNDSLQEVLKNSGKVVTVDEFTKSLDNTIKNSDMSEFGKVELRKKLGSELNTLQEAYPDGNIPIQEINKLRVEKNQKWKDSKMSGIVEDIHKVVGDASRDSVYNSTDNKQAKQILLEQKKIIHAKDFLEKLNGHKVEGGRLGSATNGLLGALTGSTMHSIPVVGPLLGDIIGKTATSIKQGLTFKSIPVEVKAGIEKLLGNKKQP